MQLLVEFMLACHKRSPILTGQPVHYTVYWHVSPNVLHLSQSQSQDGHAWHGKWTGLPLRALHPGTTLHISLLWSWDFRIEVHKQLLLLFLLFIVVFGHFPPIALCKSSRISASPPLFVMCGKVVAQSVVRSEVLKNLTWLKSDSQPIRLLRLVTKVSILDLPPVSILWILNWDSSRKSVGILSALTNLDIYIFRLEIYLYGLTVVYCTCMSKDWMRWLFVMAVTMMSIHM